RRVGVAKSTMSRYFNEKRDFPINDVGKYADALNVNVEYLLGLDKSESPSNEYKHLPVKVAAGLPENIESVNAEKISIPDSIMGKWAGQSDIMIMRVNGESMNKTIPDQSLIAV